MAAVACSDPAKTGLASERGGVSRAGKTLLRKASTVAVVACSDPAKTGLT